MIHDCAITDNYVIVLDFPLTFRVSRLLNDRFPIEYEPENGARIGLVPRNPKNKGYKSKRIRWFDCQPGVVLHSINAYEDKDENKLVLQALRSEPRGCDSFIQSFASTFLYEWVLDLETGQTTERCLNPSRLVEFPVIDAAQTGKAVDAVYCMAVSSMCNELKVRTENMWVQTLGYPYEPSDKTKIGNSLYATGLQGATGRDHF